MIDQHLLHLHIYILHLLHLLAPPGALGGVTVWDTSHPIRPVPSRPEIALTDLNFAITRPDIQVHHT